jgi:hypothetical protein
MALIVNGERIDEEILRQEFAGIKSQHAHRGQVSCCERDDEFRRLALDNVIAQTLLLQEARRTVPPVPEAAVEAALRRLQEEHGGAEKFYAAFQLTPDDEPRIRGDLAARLRIEKLLERVTGGGPEPSAEDLEAYYARNLDRYRAPERVRASHILKNPGRGEERARAMELLRALRERALAGEDFEALAREHSDRARRDGAAGEGDGIDLGWFARGEILEEFEAVAFSLREGEVSPVFVSPYGFHLAKLTGRRAPELIPLDRIRDRVREDFLAERREERLRAFLAELRGKATIEEVPDPA